MRLFVMAVVFSIMTIPVAAQTKYYQCKNARGESTFSDKPCGEDGAAKSVTGPKNSGSVRVDFSAISTSNRIRDIEREIGRLEGKIERLGGERDGKIADLDKRQTYAANNLAGAQYEAALATEMQSVTTQYQSKIDRERARIDRLDGEREKLLTE